METKKYQKPKVKLMPLKAAQFYQSTQTKNNIFLHHTAGDSAVDAINWWNQTPEHVGTPFVIDRNGTIYQCYDEKAWAYSLGVKGATKTEQHGIPIEIVSLGWLLKSDEGKYHAYPNYPSKIGGVEVKEADVVVIDYLGHKYWQKYTDAQIKSLISLMQWLVEEYEIPVQEDLENFYQYDLSVATHNKPGIWSHTTVRKDKTDIFPQKELVTALLDNFGNKKKVSK